MSPPRPVYDDHFKRPHLFFGEWIDDAELTKRIAELPRLIAERYGLAFPYDDFIELCDQYSQRLTNDTEYRARVLELCANAGSLYPDEIISTLDEVASFLAKDNLLRKVERELGTRTPHACRRLNYQSAVFEEWRPLGFLVHVAPNNAPALDILACVEGLLCGNINFLKTSGESSLLAQIFFDELCKKDVTGRVKEFLIVARIASRHESLLAQVFAIADGLSVWGSEPTIAAVKRNVPSTVNVIEWGHKISFGFISRPRLLECLEQQRIPADLALGLCRDVCSLDQRSCSSPQCLFIESESFTELEHFAELLYRELLVQSPGYPQHEPSAMEWAELSRVVEVHRLRATFENARVLEAPDRTFRLLVDEVSALEASPLQRTLRIKPLARADTYRLFHPLRNYLQTLTLSCNQAEIPDLVARFFKSGVLRIKKPGDALASYQGEPHDGVLALSRLSRRVSLDLGAQLANLSSLDELRPSLPAVDINAPIMYKADFQARVISEHDSELFFKSGGSSGAPKISVFTYDNYHHQMRLAADGLFAAGIDPVRDRCMNIFHGGGLYGGFLSFFTILEFLQCKQFPMAGYADLKYVGEAIVSNRIDCLLGMPSYIFQVFAANEDILRSYAGVKKIFYGGEYFSRAEIGRMRERFGVELVRSATYGSVDTGPMGYQCPNCEGSIHHLHTELQSLEIFDLTEDRPVVGDAVGRLLFTSHARRGQKLVRYEVGDLGRTVAAPCPCGRQSPRFELMGRNGDIFRAGGCFINFERLQKILIDEFNFGFESQVVLERTRSGLDGITLLIDEASRLDPAAVSEKILSEYSDLREIVHDGSTQFRVKKIASAELTRTAASGKLMRVVERRSL